MKRVLLILVHFFVFSFLHSTELKMPQYPVHTLPEKSLIIREMDSKIIELVTNATYSNNSDIDLTNIIHYVTMPPGDLDYQIIMDMSGNCLENATVKFHKNKIDQYLKIHFSIASGETKKLSIVYKILLIPLNYNHTLSTVTNDEYPDDVLPFLLPTKYIESDAEEIIKIAELFMQKYSYPLELAKQSYEYPSNNLKFEVQKKSLGALQTLKIGKGDCTEYSALFSALCRACSIPARHYAVFTMGDHSERSWKLPNHVIAEVYLDPIGWLPVDPNLGFGKYTNKNSFGRTSNNVLYLKREGAWVYSRARPKNISKEKLQLTVTWNATISKTGNAEELFLQYSK